MTRPATQPPKSGPECSAGQSEKARATTHERLRARVSDIEWLRRWSKKRWGSVFLSDHRELLGKRLEDAAKGMQLPVERLRQKVEADDSSAIAALGDAVSINYTEFFREPDVLAQLPSVVFPALPRSGDVRIWSAAASSGEEAYSLAILALEQIADASTRVHILGTDLSPRNVATAEAGRYSEMIIRPVSESRRKAWLREGADGVFTVAPQLRSMCTFRRMNLQSNPWPFKGRFHLILLRNVLYYFGVETRIALLKHCYEAIEPGGYLITSLTEPLSSAIASPAMWSRVSPAIYRRKA